MNSIEELYKWVGLESKYCLNWFGSIFTGKSVEGVLEKLCKKKPKCIKEAFRDDVKEITPKLTTDKAWKLEEMLRLKTQGCFYYGANKNPWFWYRIEFNGGKQGDGTTREEALASLIPKINWIESEKEQIKAILEE